MDRKKWLMEKHIGEMSINAHFPKRKGMKKDKYESM